MACCYLHIGMEKTGTTTLRMALDVSKDRIEHAGYSLIRRSSYFSNDRELVALFQNYDEKDDFWQLISESDRRKPISWTNRRLSEIDHQLSLLGNDCKLIITSEHLHSRLKTVEEIEHLYSFLSKYFDRFQVICYLRPQASTVLSLYSTALLNGTMSSWNEFLLQFINNRDYLDFERVLTKWEHVFGRQAIRVYSYSEAVSNGDLIEHFELALELRRGVLKRVNHRNVKMGGFTQKLARSINLCLSPTENSRTHFLRRILWKFSRHLIRAVAIIDSTPSLALSSDFIKCANTLYANSNARILERYGVDLKLDTD